MFSVFEGTAPSDIEGLVEGTIHPYTWANQSCSLEFMRWNLWMSVYLIKYRRQDTSRYLRLLTNMYVSYLFLNILYPFSLKTQLYNLLHNHLLTMRVNIDNLLLLWIDQILIHNQFQKSSWFTL